jgi:hypothetical protein
MKSRWLVGLILAVFVLSLAPSAGAASGDKIVRTKSLTGLPVVKAACLLLDCEVLGALDTPPGSTAPSSLFLVRGLLDNTVNFLLSLLGLAAVEPDLAVTITEDGSWGSNQATAAVLDQATAAVLDQLWDRTPMTYYGSTAWESYLTQPAADIVGLRDAHCDLRATGGGLVAVIDTGVDVDHPTPSPPWFRLQLLCAPSAQRRPTSTSHRRRPRRSELGERRHRRRRGPCHRRPRQRSRSRRLGQGRWWRVWSTHRPQARSCP